MHDLKEIAQTIAIEFPAAVKAADLADAREIESIMRSFNDAWTIYNGRLDKLGAEQVKLLEERANAETLYADEVQTLSSRLEKYRAAKAEGAAPQSNLDRPAKPNGKLSELGG